MKVPVDECLAELDMDAVIARILGRKVVGIAPRYSADIFEAIELECEMPYFSLRRLSPTHWQCQSASCGTAMDHSTSRCGCKFADANTPALAISRAFLKANDVNFREFCGDIRKGKADRMTDIPYSLDRSLLEHWKKDIDTIAESWVDLWTEFSLHIAEVSRFTLGLLGGILLTLTSPIWIAPYLLLRRKSQEAEQ